MTYTLLPVHSDSGNYKFTTELSDTRYIFEIIYNNRAGRWALSMYESDGTAIFQGLYLVLGVDYFALFLNDALPYGALQLINTKAEFTEPTRNNLGTDCILVFDDGITV